MWKYRQIHVVQDCFLFFFIFSILFEYFPNYFSFYEITLKINFLIVNISNNNDIIMIHLTKRSLAGVNNQLKRELRLYNPTLCLKSQPKCNVRTNSQSAQVNKKILSDNSMLDFDLSKHDHENFMVDTELTFDSSQSSDILSTFHSLSDSSQFITNDIKIIAEESFPSDYEYIIKQSVFCYIHVCIHNDNIQKADVAFRQFLSKYSTALSPIDIKHGVELLAKGYARIGRTAKVEELFNFTKHDLKLMPNIDFYEIHLLSLAKQMRTLCKEDIASVLTRLNKNGYSAEKLFQQSTLSCFEIDLVKKMLNKYEFNISYLDCHYPTRTNISIINSISASPHKNYEPFAGIPGLKDSALANADKQFENERDGVVEVPCINARFYDTEEKKSPEVFKKLICKFEKEWRVSLTNGFKNHLKNNTKKFYGIPINDFFTIFNTNIYVDLMLDEVRKCSTFSEYYCPFATILFEELGQKLMQKYLHVSDTKDQTLPDFRKCYNNYLKYTFDSNLIQTYSPREYWLHLMEIGFHYNFDDSKQWPRDLLREIGKDLYEIIVKEVKFKTDFSTSLQPAISFAYRNHETYKTRMEIKTNPTLINLYQDASTNIFFETERLPMLSPPVPWVSPDFGGNFLIRTFIVRTPRFYPKHHFRKFPKSQMFPTYDALNALSLCPWKINSKILDLAIHIFQNKGNLDLDIPVSLSRLPPLPGVQRGLRSRERAELYNLRKERKKEHAEMYSLWIDCLYKLSIGNYLRDKVFWFPINADFRSRVYPIPPNFNHLGSDLSRSLLLFAKGKPLGKDGLRWLKVHLINLTGFKKRSSSDERLQFCEDNMDLIMDSADNPLDGKKWWMESDEKWQTLACCIELTNAIRSGDPENYVSFIPVHQDGSCNGLQHYAALGRDVLGARSVNLEPSKIPQDVYSDVAALVESEIENDFKNGVEIAKVLRGNISRKLVKQTVMTYVYGVTGYGANMQVLRRLKEDSTFPQEHKSLAAVYVSKKILSSIGHMFTQTRVIQDWLTNCAQIISHNYSSAVQWVTPMGFPVIQCYYKPPKRSKNFQLIPNVVKQKNAFPANFIHSLDSTHMMLTSLECHHNGLTFASVHDCYWTHACDINVMNQFCRKQFVALHSEPILDNLGEFLKELIEKQNIYLKVPQHAEHVKAVLTKVPKGDFSLNSIMKSEFFFS